MTDDIIEVVFLQVLARLNRSRVDQAQERYIKTRISASIAEHTRIGINLTESLDDMLLLADTVSWEYANRDKADGMPLWLRLRRRERWIQERGGVG